jgi:hypothetical protein
LSITVDIRDDVSNNKASGWAFESVGLIVTLSTISSSREPERDLRLSVVVGGQSLVILSERDRNKSKDEEELGKHHFCKGFEFFQTVDSDEIGI